MITFIYYCRKYPDKITQKRIFKMDLMEVYDQQTKKPKEAGKRIAEL